MLMETNDEKEKHTRRERERKGGMERRTKTLVYALSASGGGPGGERKDRQTNDVLSQKV